MTVAAAAERALTITNPLVLYRSLVATKKIEPDPAQHRLAIHLQKIYHRLKDYEPQVEYRRKLNQLSSTLDAYGSNQGSGYAKTGSSYLDLWRQRKTDKASLALVRTVTDHEAALQIDSPQGLLLHGEVGTGKSMLVDLLADSLPSRKKRRWHFNTFMLDAFARLERLRLRHSKEIENETSLQQEYSLVSLARDMIITSPVLFLDEFQLPDRAASEILSNLFTSFFHLGGVLIATSNRMPEELAKASGLEFAPSPSSSSAYQTLKNSILGTARDRRNYKNTAEQNSDFAAFLDVLRARCEVWNIEGHRDWRRRDSFSGTPITSIASGAGELDKAQSEEGPLPKYYQLGSDVSDSILGGDQPPIKFESRILKILGMGFSTPSPSLASIPWEPLTLYVYRRPLYIPRTHNGTAFFTFTELCAANLGPADYTSLASTFHTFIITSVPILTLLEKNAARRFITLLDALYEARCKLLIQAAAGPDELFFPEKSLETQRSMNGDETYAETFSEIYQDTTSPFRPNVSAYAPSASIPDYDTQPLPRTRPFDHNNPESDQGPAYPSKRSILADEDSDFGPTYGARRSFPSSSSSLSSFLPRDASGSNPHDEGSPHAIVPALDFQRSTLFTGEDERFAYKRARSRLWEMCGERWWARESSENNTSAEEHSGKAGWWRPLPLSARPWESRSVLDEPTADGGVANLSNPNRNAGDRPSISAVSTLESLADMQQSGDGVPTGTSFANRKSGTTDMTNEMFKHSASPFRTSPDPPPRISWVHAWGMMRWGKKAGDWGKGSDKFEKGRSPNGFSDDRKSLSHAKNDGGRESSKEDSR